MKSESSHHTRRRPANHEGREVQEVHALMAKKKGPRLYRGPPGDELPESSEFEADRELHFARTPAGACGSGNVTEGSRASWIHGERSIIKVNGIE